MAFQNTAEAASFISERAAAFRELSEVNGPAIEDVFLKLAERSVQSHKRSARKGATFLELLAGLGRGAHSNRGQIIRHCTEEGLRLGKRIRMACSLGSFFPAKR